MPDSLKYDPNVKTEYFLKENKDTIGLYTNDIKFKDDALVDVYYTSKYKSDDKRIYSKLQTGNSKISNKQIANKIIYVIGKKQFILDIDLDYFTSNGVKMDKDKYLKDPYDVASIKRVKKIVLNEDNPRNFYEGSKEIRKYQEDLEEEISLINKRIKRFLSLLNTLKNEGYTPSYISVCDSTNIAFSKCYNCNSRNNGYVSQNLALMINRKIHEGLKELYE
jgi:hypothetical protein